MACALFDTISNDPIPSGPQNYASNFARAFIFASVFQVSLHLRDAYDFRVRLLLLNIVIRFMEGIALACLAVSILYFALPSLRVGPASISILFLRAATIL